MLPKKFKFKHGNGPGVFTAEYQGSKCGYQVTWRGDTEGTFYCLVIVEDNVKKGIWNIIEDKKYLMYNKTMESYTFSNISKEDAIAYAKDHPQNEYQLFELKYNLMPVKVEYEAVEV